MVGNSSAVSFHVVIDEETAVECIPFRATPSTLATARKALPTATSSASRSPAPPKNPATASAAQRKTPPLHRPRLRAVRLDKRPAAPAQLVLRHRMPPQNKGALVRFPRQVDENIATIKAAGEDHPAPSAPRSHSSPSAKPSTSRQKTETAPSTPQSAPSAKRWDLTSSGKTAR